MLWCRLATAAPIQPLSWELPYAAGATLKRQKKKKKKRKKKKKNPANLLGYFYVFNPETHRSEIRENQKRDSVGAAKMIGRKPSKWTPSKESIPRKREGSA